MNKRQLGNSDLYVSEIGLGCMSLGTDEAKAIKLIHEALELGVNYLDTADLYDRGLNEEFIGKALKGKRHEVIIATKVGNRWQEGKEGWTWDPSKAYIKQAVKESLRRLQTDYIDLYQLHGGTINDPIDETIEAFEELKQEGVIRYYGISSIRPNVIREYVKRSNIVSVMMQYSLLDRRPEELFPLLHEHNISVIARGPLAKGILTERPLEMAGEDVKTNGYLDYSYEEIEQLLPRMKAVASDLSLTTIALQFCLAHPVVAAVIPGASRLEQLRENVAAQSSPLSAEQYDRLKEMTKQSFYRDHR
ncbi:aryl-alcohol dehydrogenase-like predicted oxidoreductase [Thermolongibacillus altinsuensis]|jgi:aryl-alcohol dehydrogenase-like predicted oxidoreductase|uniref:Aryl-alcohol dehydrogenase-like predicted oxidoreductase n=1 Tax=Thermolongibacillus altinsuensis TaxID=575256 RepID=A0A4R1QQL9_9BACL|nr:aldo/keto reductase [Thermolongibacillus altinsuensis]TCL53064.1 aryl-alcohol dehydrogenase-like predicted oxidoreductase [Thermolongibacillus altinsuensis]GMB07766.1 putative oxidoreductase YqkF [Thermolongibacillus altinsuensis]